MARIIWGLGLVLIGAGLWYWLRCEDGGTRAPERLEIVEEESAEAAAPADRKRPAPSQNESEPDPFAEIDDPKELVKPLGDYRSAKAAGERLRVLLGSDAERIRAFLRLLHPDTGLGTLANYATKRAVTAALLAAGDVALDVLLEELDDANATWRTHMDALIGAFGRQAERAVPRLLQQLDEVPEDPPAGEAASVVYALGAIGPAAKELLPDIHGWLNEGATEDVEIAAARALIQIGGPTEETWTHCRELLRAVNWPKQRGAALLQIGLLGEAARPMIPYLLQLIGEGLLDEFSVLNTFGQMGVADAQVLEYVATRFREEEGYEMILGSYGGTLARLGKEGRDLLYRLAKERGSAALAHLPEAFHSMEPSYTRLFAAMEPAFSSPAMETRLAAINSLSGLDKMPDPIRVRVALRGLSDAATQVRLASAWLLVHVKNLPSDAARVLLVHVEDPEETLEIALVCVGALDRFKRWRTERLFNAILALQRKHPRDRELLFRLRVYVPTHAEVVLRLWAEGVASGRLRWRFFVRELRDLPAHILRPYLGARKAVREGPRR